MQRKQFTKISGQNEQRLAAHAIKKTMPIWTVERKLGELTKKHCSIRTRVH